MRPRLGLYLFAAGVFVIDSPQCGSPGVDHLPLAVAYLEVENYPRVLAETRRAEREAGVTAESALIAALAHLGLEAPNRALQALIHGLTEHPTDPRLHATLRSVSARYGLSAQALQEIQPLVASATPAASMLATAGWLHADCDELEEALVLLQRAVATDSTTTFSGLQLSRVLQQLGRPAESRIILEQAVHRAPGDPDVLLALGAQQLRGQDHAAAAASFERLLAAVPEAGDAAMRIAMACYDAGAADWAIRYYERALEWHGEAPLLLNNLAWTYAELGRQLPRALRLATRAVELAPNNVVYLDTHAEVHFRLGQPARAAAIMRRALELEPPGAPQHAYLTQQLARFRSAPKP